MESPITGEMIFLPEGVGKREEPFKPGGYWSSSLSWDDPGYALTMLVWMPSKSIGIYEEERYVGHRIRPVYDDGEPYVPEPETKEPEAIDLGLSVKWASFNVGASSPEESGNYYAWGVIEPYHTPSGHMKAGYENGYDWDSYKWCSGSIRSLKKYVTDSYYGAIDNKTMLESLDDAAN